LEDIGDKIDLTSVNVDSTLPEYYLASCRAVLATDLDGKLGYRYDCLESGKEAFRGECGVNELGFEVEGTGNDVILRVRGNLDIEFLSLPDLGEVRVPSENMVVRGVAKGNVELVEGILP
jgi:hypothetical protein